MKKLLVLFAMLLLCTAVPVASAEALSATVTVAVEGQWMGTDTVAVTDRDGDGALTLSDALDAFHEKNCKGGYATAQTEWGLSITKLWKNESGNFGYWKNNASVLSLTEPLAEGDYITAFVYRDAAAFSDLYCYFDQQAVSLNKGEEVTLTLQGMVMDPATFTFSPAPVAGATVTVNGKKTAYVTDESGKVTVKAEKSGKLLISATHEELVLVPPVCQMAVEGGGESQWMLTALLVLVGGFFIGFGLRKKKHEKN